MAVENITLNLIPTGETPSIHVAQFDVERPFTVTLKEGADDFTPTGYDIELQVRKVDNNIVTAIPTSTSGNVVTFNTTEQMTACSGTNLAELQLSKNDQTFATLHFYLVVQRDVLAGGVTSESAIHDLEEQIAEIVPTVIGDDYYNKEEVDELIADIPTFDPTNYYDKSDVNLLLNDKANASDLSAVAFSGDYDDLLNKPSIPAAQVQSDWAQSDNTQVDYIKNKPIIPIVETATIENTAIAHFTDGADNVPVKSLASEIVAVESGSGEKSPDNPYTISGFDSGVVPVCGVNLWDEEIEGGYIDTNDGTEKASTTFSRSKNYCFIKPETTYYLKCDSNLTPIVICFYDIKDNYLGYLSTNTVKNKAFTSLANACKFRIYFTTSGYNNNISLNYPSTDTSYHAYNGNTYTFAFGQTVYGGHFDNKGNLVVTHGYIASYNGETINEPWISSMDEYVPNTSPSTGAQVVYPLANPITIAITSQDIPTILGENNIFSNCGDLEELTYFKTGCESIARLIEAYL